MLMPSLAHESTPLTRLRERTRLSHEALHGHPMLAPLAAGRADRHRLRRTAIAFYGFHQGCDAVLPDASIAGFEPSPQTEWLRQDLLALGIASADLIHMPICAGLPAVAGRGAHLGHLYVREGSTLGGQGIAKSLLAALGAGPEAGYRYFAGHGPKVTGARWKRFVALVEMAGSAEAEEAADHAGRLFEALESWLMICCRTQ